MASPTVPYYRLDCSGNEKQYVDRVLESGWLTTASMATELERLVKESTGAKYAIAVNSCTSGLHLALESMGIGPGDKVLVPTMTFTASAEVIRYLGADPVFLDVDYGTAALSEDIVKSAIAEHPDAKALIVVHYGGQAAPMLGCNGSGIYELCQSNGIQVVEDAAHAFPAKDNGKMIGSIGDVTCLSFYANKTMTTGEGGMVLTNSDEIAERVGIMRLHGINRSIWDRFTDVKQGNSWEYDVLAPGFKYNMPDLNAAVGVAQFERVHEMRTARQRIAQIYIRELGQIESLDMPVVRVNSEDHAWHLSWIVLNEHSKIERNELIERLTEDGIGTSVHYKPLHRMTYYRERYKLSCDAFPNAERLWKGTVSLPLFSSMTDDELNWVIQRVTAYVS